MGVEMFPLPFGLRLTPEPAEPSYHLFVMTMADGARFYGHCYSKSRRLSADEVRHLAERLDQGDSTLPESVYAPSCLVICTHVPLHWTFERVLRAFTVYEPDFTSDALCRLHASLRVPAPWGNEVRVRIHDTLLKCLFPTQEALPLIDVDFRLPFCLLSPVHVVEVFSLLLLEQHVVFISDHLEYLGPCAEAFLALLYPIRWPHVYIPVLPAILTDFFAAPMPFLIGCHRSVLPAGIEAEPVVIVDLDRNTIQRPPASDQFVDEELPARFRLRLYKVIQRHANLYFPRHPDAPDNTPVMQECETQTSARATSETQSHLTQKTLDVLFSSSSGTEPEVVRACVRNEAGGFMGTYSVPQIVDDHKRRKQFLDESETESNSTGSASSSCEEEEDEEGEEEEEEEERATDETEPTEQQCAVPSAEAMHSEDSTACEADNEDSSTSSSSASASASSSARHRRRSGQRVKHSDASLESRRRFEASRSRAVAIGSDKDTASPEPSVSSPVPDGPPPLSGAGAGAGAGSGTESTASSETSGSLVNLVHSGTAAVTPFIIPDTFDYYPLSPLPGDAPPPQDLGQSTLGAGQFSWIAVNPRTETPASASQSTPQRAQASVPSSLRSQAPSSAPSSMSSLRSRYATGIAGGVWQLVDGEPELSGAQPQDQIPTNPVTAIQTFHLTPLRRGFLSILMSALKDYRHYLIPPKPKVASLHGAPPVPSSTSAPAHAPAHANTETERRPADCRTHINERDARVIAIPEPRDDDLFDSRSYLTMVPDDAFPFIHQFFQTQIFSCFIQERVTATKPDLFERTVLEKMKRKAFQLGYLSSQGLSDNFYKLGHFVRNWKKRHFELRGLNLAYFRGAKKCGEIILVPGETVIVIPFNLPRNAPSGYPFEIRTPAKNLVICTDTHEKRRKWIKVMKAKTCLSKEDLLRRFRPDLNPEGYRNIVQRQQEPLNRFLTFANGLIHATIVPQK